MISIENKWCIIHKSKHINIKNHRQQGWHIFKEIPCVCHWVCDIFLSKLFPHLSSDNKVNHFVFAETPFDNLAHCFSYFKELVLCHAVKVSVDYAVRQVCLFLLLNGPLNTPYKFLLVFHIYPSLYPWSPKLCSEAVVNWLGKTWIFTQMFMLDCRSAWLYESVLLRTRMLLPNTGRKIPNWLLRIIFLCA